MNHELAVLFAKRFIQRRDVKAVQVALPDRIIYMPDREMKPQHIGRHAPLGFLMDHLYAHLDGSATYGHYLLDNEDNTRMFCFDIDLKQNDDDFTGYYMPLIPWDGVQPEAEWEASQLPVAFNPREDWLNRAHPSRPWLKMQMGMLARKLTAAIQRELNIPCAAAYSGNKGIHVYGFTGPLPAIQVRAAALFVLEATNDWELERGHHIWRYKLQDPALGYPNINLEVYPKQDSLAEKDLGNLLRLPLGKNLKNPLDPTFFLDLTTPPGVMQPHPNPVRLLENGNPYE